MATLNPNENSGLLDQSIPQWKRELILKRRALGRTLQAGKISMKPTCPVSNAGVGRNDDSIGAGGVRIGNVSGTQQRCTSNVVAVVSNESSLDQNEADFHPGRSSTHTTGSVLNMRYVNVARRVDVTNGVGLINSGVSSTEKVMLDNDRAFKCVVSANKMGEEKSIIIKRPNSGSAKSVTDNNKCDSVIKRKQLRPNSVSSVVPNSENKAAYTNEEDDDHQSDSSEELKYGPGIVNKLKTKYLSMTLRENQKRGVRPSLSNLRRATSLENMLEDDLKTQQQNIIVSSSRSSNLSNSYKKLIDKNNSKVSKKSAAVSVNYQFNLNRTVYSQRNVDSIMKRACSMDTLLHGEVQTNKSVILTRLNKANFDKDSSSVSCKGIGASIANDDLIIVENSNSTGPNTSPNEEGRAITSQQPFSRGIKTSSSVEEKELPPPDVVKQTLKKFENSPKSKTSVTVQKKIKVVSVQNSKPYRPTSSSLSNSISSSTLKDKQSVNKPLLSPKPILNSEKSSSLSRTYRLSSPKRYVKGKIDDVNRITSQQNNNSKISTENSINVSKEVVKSVVDNIIPVDTKQPQLTSVSVNHNKPTVSPVHVSNDSVLGQSVDNFGVLSVLNKTNIIEQNLSKSPEFNDRTASEVSVSSLKNTLLNDNESDNGGHNDNNDDDKYSDVFEDSDSVGEVSKPIPNDALENIRKTSTSVKFNFKNEDNWEANNSSVTKSHLPVCKDPSALQATNTTLLLASQSNPVVKVLTSALKQDPLVVASTQVRQVGVIRPILNSSKNQQNSTVSQVKPLVCSSLSDLEIEKNLINSVKSIEQPVSKVVVAIKTLPDSVVLGPAQTELSSNKVLALPSTRMSNTEVKSRDLWSDKKLWHQNQNTMIFNFSDRKDVPDYIENDGLILRGKRERPKPGDGGFVFLGGSGRHESSTDFEEESGDDWSSFANDPPSPCDVTFVNDNILINGKSNLRKHPRQHKLRIQFKEEATTFEYPSESSLAEQLATTSAGGTDEGDAVSAQRPKSPPPRVPVASATVSSSSSSSMPSVPCLGGSSLASYTPSKLGNGEGWQPGITRHVVPSHNTNSSKSSTSGDDAAATNSEYFRPATGEQTVTWSEETSTTDLLF